MKSRTAITSLRNAVALTALAVGGFAGITRAEDAPDAGYRFTEPSSVHQPPAPASPAGRLTIEQVGQMLDATYPGRNTISTNGDTYYTINIQRDTWKFHLIVSLSPNGNVLWVNAPLTKLDAPVSAAALADLLKKNCELGPMFFQITNRQMLEITEPLPNHDMSVEKFHALIEEMLGSIQRTEPLWTKQTLTPGADQASTNQPAAEKPISIPAPVERPRNPLAQ